MTYTHTYMYVYKLYIHPYIHTSMLQTYIHMILECYLLVIWCPWHASWENHLWSGQAPLPDPWSCGPLDPIHTLVLHYPETWSCIWIINNSISPIKKFDFKIYFPKRTKQTKISKLIMPSTFCNKGVGVGW